MKNKKVALYTKEVEKSWEFDSFFYLPEVALPGADFSNLVATVSKRLMMANKSFSAMVSDNPIKTILLRSRIYKKKTFFETLESSVKRDLGLRF